MRTPAHLGLGLALALALAGMLAAPAAAQPVATGGLAPRSTAAATRRPDPHPPAGLGAAIVAGAAGMEGAPDGWVARLEYELFPVLAPRGTVGPIFGFHLGWEYWRAKPDWGLGMPITIVLGVRTPLARATVGVGFYGFTVDEVDDDAGFGLYAPFAGARLGADIFGFQLGADARIVRRWQIGAPDHTQWQLGAFVGGTWESKYRGPRY